MFRTTFEFGVFPNADALVKTALDNIAQEVGRPLVGMVRAKLLRSAGDVPPERKDEFTRYVNSIDLWFEGNIVRIGGSTALEQTGLDLEFGENGMPYVPHIRSTAPMLAARIDAVATMRMKKLTQGLAKGMKRIRKVV